MALDFDGVDDAVSFGTQASLDGAAALTVLMHIFPTTNDVASGWWGNENTNGIMIFEAAAGSFTVHFTAGPTQGDVAGLLTTGAWGHYGFVYDGAGAANSDRLKIYKNAAGQAVTFSGTIPAVLGSVTTTVQLARRPDIGGEFSDGNIANLKIWLAALSVEEVRREMLSYTPVRVANLWQWCPLDDELNALDYSGNGRHGTVAGAAPVQVPGPPDIAYPDQVRQRGIANRLAAGRRSTMRRLGPLVPRFPLGV